MRRLLREYALWRQAGICIDFDKVWNAVHDDKIGSRETNHSEGLVDFDGGFFYEFLQC